PDMRRWRTFLFVIVIGCGSIRSQERQETCSANSIDAYASRIDSNLKHMKVRYFADAGSSEKSDWEETKEVIQESEVASVYLNENNLPVAAFFTIQTESGDWILYAAYYFRPDGSLAKKHERLNTFYGHAIVIRDVLHGCHGEVL